MSRHIETKGHFNKIYQCLRWMYLILFHTGCLCFSPHRNKLRITRCTMLYTYSIRIVLLGCFFGGLLMKLSNFQSSCSLFGNSSPILLFVQIFECVISISTYIMISIVIEYKKKQHISLLNKIMDIDRKVQKDFGVKWNYEKSIRKNTSLTIFVISFHTSVSLIFVFNVTNCGLSDYLSTLIMAVPYACLTAAPACAGFLHVAMVDLLRIRYRLCHKLFVHYITTNENIIEMNSKLVYATSRSIIGYFKEYNELILDINGLFGFVSVISVFYDFGILTNAIFLLCHKSIESNVSVKELIFIIVFIIPRLYKVIITAVHGYVADKEKENCQHKIFTCKQVLAISFRNHDDIFLQWKIHNNYSLSIGKSIRANFVIVFMVLNGIAKYVIVLVQLQLQQKIIKAQVKDSDLSKLAESL